MTNACHLPENNAPGPYNGQLISLAIAIGVSGELSRGIAAAQRASVTVIGRSYM